MEQSRFHRLSPRHRDCLRLTYAHRTSKEIARELGIGLGTVNSYLTEAIAIIGARNRREAAVLFHTYDAPAEFRGQSAGVDPALSEPPTGLPTGARATFWGPFDPKNREADNELGIVKRLGWIIASAVALAIGFGALVGGAHTLTELYLALAGLSSR